MLKEKAVASLGQQSLLMPAWIKAALAANDRLKLYLSILQSAAVHAASPETPLADWRNEIRQLGLRDSAWLQELVKTAYYDDRMLMTAQLGRLLDAFASDLSIMARPVCEGSGEGRSDLAVRRDKWLQKLRAMEDDEGLAPEAITRLTDGNRKTADSLHILIMDLHRQVNTMSSAIATEDLDGAHVWQIEDADRPLIQAFMRGLHRTEGLKFSHPGLDTAVTRDGSKLLIQNDIGTNDVHVLVIDVEGQTIRLSYSDLHPARFDFFRALLQRSGYQWVVLDPVTSDGLNAGKPYQVGRATFLAADQKALTAALEVAASRIVFLIDWNRARKRLQSFVRKPQAIAILERAAVEEWGHMAWLLAGAERLVFSAMQAVDSEVFRVGDRLDDVLGESPTVEFLTELLRSASLMLRQQQPVAMVADEARMLLARVLRQRSFEFDLLAEHAAYCHALAAGLCEALENGLGANTQQPCMQVARAKGWERRADHLLIDARQRAERQGRWTPMADLLAKSDDVADALEEAIFIHSMTQVEPLAGLPAPVNAVLSRMAEATLAAIQDQVRAIEIGRHVSESADSAEIESFLQVLWRVLRAERHCDDLLRQARMTILQTLHASAAGLLLANDLAATIEQASDSLLGAGHALRRMVLAKTGMPA